MDASAYLAVAIPVLAAVVSAAGAVWIARINTRKDLSATINSGFKDLTDQLQEERDNDRKYIVSLRDERAAERRHNADLERTIRRMEAYLDRVERLVAKHGLEMPPHDPF